MIIQKVLWLTNSSAQSNDYCFDMKITDIAIPESESSALEFPAIMDVKVFVQGQGTNELDIERIVLSVLETESLFGISVRQSAKRNFQSFSCKVRLVDRAELDALFQALSDYPSVKMVL